MLMMDMLMLVFWFMLLEILALLITCPFFAVAAPKPRQSDSLVSCLFVGLFLKCRSLAELPVALVLFS